MIARRPVWRAGVWLGISLVGLTGCRRVCGDDVYPAIPDDRVPPVQVVSNPNDPAALGDLVAGTGRVAQEGRRMVFQVSASDSTGAALVTRRR